MGFLLHVYIESGPRYGEMIKQRSSYTPYHSNMLTAYMLQYLTRCLVTAGMGLPLYSPFSRGFSLT